MHYKLDSKRQRQRWLCAIKSNNHLPNAHEIISSEVDDKYVWYPEPDRGTCVFSASETWRVLHPYPVEVFWHKAVWFSGRIPKHAFITWVAARDRMVMRDRLLRWGLTVPSNCVLCVGNQENRQHLFFDCAYSNQVWTYFISRLHLNPRVVLRMY